ncbi:lamin tail domain-containing protein, partial [Rubrivirga sp.]|uniref:lamin tail domain-containing protein n=1 Tax=Rubrivirga sp. TaxID=1885344 RepID=UPI003C78FAA9
MIRLAALILLSAALGVAQAQPTAGDLAINEVMYDPPAPQLSGNEWIEVVTVLDIAVDLGGLTVTDGSGTSDPVPAGALLEARGFVVLVRSADAFAAAYPGVAFIALEGFPSLNNSGDRVAIVAGGLEVDAVPYDPSWGGSDASLERRDPLGPSDQASNYGTTTSPSGGTPGFVNTLFAQDTEPPSLIAAGALDAQTVRLVFDEALDPATSTDVSRYAVNGTAPLMADLGADGSEIILALAVPLTGRQTATVTVTGVADLRGNVLTSASRTFFFGEGDPADVRDLVINEFLYDEPTSDNPGEFVELFNRTDKAFDLREFTLNDGTGDAEPVTDQPVFVEPGGYAVVVEDGALFGAVFPGVEFIEQPSWSALNNSGDAIVLAFQGVTVDSLLYTPSWGGEDASLERRDPDGPSSVSANWATTTDLRGGTPGEVNSQFAPDVTGPLLLSATASRSGLEVEVVLDEPLTPSSATAGAFSVEGAAVTAADYRAESTSVTLTLASPLSAGTSTVTATGLIDLLGNATPTSTTTVDFTPDGTAPEIASAASRSDRVVRVTFTEPVTFASASRAESYRVDATFTPASVDVVGRADGGITSVDLTFAEPFADRSVPVLEVSNLQDLAGNVTVVSAGRFFVGQPDTPGPGEIVISEIMYDPQTGSDGEYLEVVNTTADRVFDLEDVRVDDGDADGDPLTSEPTILLPGQVLAVARDLEAVRSVFPDAVFADGGSAISLSNSGEAVVLRAAGAVLDSVFYQPDWHRVELDDATGISLERRDLGGDANSAANWSSSLDDLGGTPSR